MATLPNKATANSTLPNKASASSTLPRANLHTLNNINPTVPHLVLLPVTHHTRNNMAAMALPQDPPWDITPRSRLARLPDPHLDSLVLHRDLLPANMVSRSTGLRHNMAAVHLLRPRRATSLVK